MGVIDTLVPRPGLKVLISGGAAGIGAAIAEAFVEARAEIHVCDASDDALAAFRARFPDALATKADVASASDVDAVFAAHAERFGALDVLVNNAGVAGPTAGVDAIDEATWTRTIDVNLNAQHRFASRAVPLLKRSDEARIICISSVAGRLGYAWRTPYAATKWAIVGMMKSLAIELGPDDVRVNALLPGIVEGPRMDGVIRARAEQTGVPEPEMREEYLRKISLGRMVTAQDVAAMALFLCSPAGRNVTGQAISVDGDVQYL
ncbi:SDR family oxidoreductase [Chenggangzhangella methanolivorans]|uniref:SDR family oxidoreductase n=1 Tax=Chenggangzhangella methanolivorans TaxID=1437009 RepID=A0A9E6UGE2_9HYPH|nr:SDR family oxidoreductase [Chenggangzhangella methanolivorans]QZN98637.1 SDR family oxidoreductase [Chenggangzhangella methanolivorans]